MYFEWRDEYHTGIDAIDKQHRHLLGIGARTSNLHRTTNMTDMMISWKSCKS